MKDDLTFYVYEHWRPDIDICFYVGKGRKKRAYNFKRNNRHHRHIVDKLSSLGMCAEVKLVQSGLSESEAFALEKTRIAFWLSSGVELTNRTEGGEGNSNPHPEVRAKMSASQKARIRSESELERVRLMSKSRADHPNYREQQSKAAYLGFARPGRERTTETLLKQSQSMKRVHAERPELAQNHSVALSGRPAHPNSRAALDSGRMSRLGATNSPEHRLAISVGKKGKPQSAAQKSAMKANAENRRGTHLSEEHIAKLTGKVRSEETKARMRASWAARKATAEFEETRKRLSEAAIAREAAKREKA
jgi:hypothetical protein